MLLGGRYEKIVKSLNEQQRRLYVRDTAIAITFSFLAITALFIFGLYHAFILQNAHLAIFELIMANLTTLNVLLIRYTGMTIVTRQAMMVILSAILLTMLLTGGISQTGIYWLFTFPLVALVINGRKWGVGWIITLAIGLAAATMMQNAGIIILQYATVEIRQAIFVFLVLAALIYYFVLQIERNESTVEHHAAEVESSSGKMIAALELYKKEIAKKEETQKELEHTADDLKKYKLAVKYAFDQIVLTDPDGIVLYANDATERNTGYSKTDIIGKKVGTKELWGGLMDEGYYDDLWETIKTKRQPVSRTITNKRKNGKKYQAELSIVPILNVKRHVEYFVGIERVLPTS